MSRRWPPLAAVLGVAAIGSALAVGGGEQPKDAEPRATRSSPSPTPGAVTGSEVEAEAMSEPMSEPEPDDPEPPATLDDPAAPPEPPLPVPALDPRTAPRWIAAASGPVPELNQVSLEQDIALAAEVLGPGGRVLFGAGPGTPTVQVLAPPRALDPVVAALADLFAPRGDRAMRYRPTRLTKAEPATAHTVFQALDHALAGGPDPLLLYLGGHGNLGDLPRYNTVSLWAQSELSVVDLATRLDQSPRPVRLLVTTCFSGGFADLVFRGADEALGASPNERCGLFAAPWDLEATGCDPNPDRATHDGYGLHVLQALRGRDRGGQPLPPEALDLDHDGRVSLLEAHTRARIATDAADVPTTTAERWLRHAAPSHGPEQPVDLPEEDAVVQALADALGVRGQEDAARLELQRLRDDLQATLRSLDDAGLDEDAAYRDAAAELLARWPVLDDPWHPDHHRVLQREHDAIERHLARSDAFADYLAARERVDQLGQRTWDLRRKAAPYERLVRALDNRQLAARLRARGGEGWAVYERILGCERGVP